MFYSDARTGAAGCSCPLRPHLDAQAFLPTPLLLALVVRRWWLSSLFPRPRFWVLGFFFGSFFFFGWCSGFVCLWLAGVLGVRFCGWVGVFLSAVCSVLVLASCLVLPRLASLRCWSGSGSGFVWFGLALDRLLCCRPSACCSSFSLASRCEPSACCLASNPSVFCLLASSMHGLIVGSARVSRSVPLTRFRFWLFPSCPFSRLPDFFSAFLFHRSFFCGSVFLLYGVSPLFPPGLASLPTLPLVLSFLFLRLSRW